MVAIFTPRKELAQLAAEKAAGPLTFPDQHLYPDAQFKGATLYEGRVRVTMAGPGQQVSFELLDGTYAGAGIVASDEIFVEADSAWIAGSWTVGTVSDPSAEVDPLDPPEEIEIVTAGAGSYATVAPNRVRGAIDITVEARISAAIPLTTDNLRARGTLGFSAFSDNLRQLTFDGAVSGAPALGGTVTGGTSTATGTIVGLSPGITAGGAGHWIVVDMGLDYAGPEFQGGEAITGDVAGTLAADPLGARSFSPLSPIGSERRNAPSLALPPFATDMVNFWDPTDPSQVFEDQAGTTPASEGGLMRRQNNKGTSGLEVSESGTGVPTWKAAADINAPNGLNYAQSTLGAGYFVTPYADGVDWSAGFTCAGAFAANGTGTLVAMAYGSSAMNLQFVETTGLWRIDVPGIGFVNFGKATVDDEWIWMYCTINAAGDYAIRMSGAAEVVGSGTYSAPPQGGLSLWSPGGQIMRGAGTFMYNRYLTPAERPAVIAYFDQKFGVMPF